MIPHKPEPVAVLKARAGAVFARPFDCRDGQPFPRPGECRENVFDFEDGVRVIASLDRHDAPTGLVLHVSASFGPACPFFFAVRRKGVAGIDWACEEMLRRAADLLGVDPGRFDGPHFPTPKKVPHWFVTWGDGCHVPAAVAVVSGEVPAE